MKQSTIPIKYAIVDIETTGGSALRHRIIEIAIVVTDGKKLLQQYETLIHPDTQIPYFITDITGINNSDVKSAPKFDKVADEIFEILNDCVFVAHNVNFDFSFVKNELAKCKLTFNPPKLCTVKLSRKILPGFTSYSLGTLCKNVGVEIKNRHRAMGDAYATFEIFLKLLQNDFEHAIEKTLSSPSRKKNSFAVSKKNIQYTFSFNE